MRIVAGDAPGDEKKDRARTGASTADGAAAVALAAVIGDRGKAGELGDGLVREDADLGQLGHQPGDGTGGDALERTEGLIEARPQGIVIDQGGNFAFELAALPLEEGDDLVEAGDDLGLDHGAASGS